MHLGEKVLRINKDDNNYKFDSITNDGIYFENYITKELVNLKEVKSCWWRRTGLSINQFKKQGIRVDLEKNAFDLSSLLNSNYMNDEFDALKEYIFESIYKTCKINLGKPLFNLNRLKVFEIAKNCGLITPKYEIISNWKQLENSKESLGKIVTKAISNGIYEEIRNHRFYTYTELVEEKLYTENVNNTFFPSLITGLVEKKIEIRSFFIDGHFFSMAIFSQSNEKTKIDFRKYGNNRNEPYKLPDNIENKLKKVFKELELNCGSVDLIVDQDDNYVFLEINPVGQYGMTSEPCNYNLDKLIANYLIDGRVKTD
jgi:ATP-GRASP peptide maturase of grasp-with-spasm system